MINKKDFAEIRKTMDKIEVKRESIIRNSREIIGLSKQIIYALQRDDVKSAEKLVKDINAKIEKLRDIKIDFSIDTNISNVAFQEYVEALCFYDFIRFGKLPSHKTLKVSSEDYLMGICDLTGELCRKAIFEVIHKRFREAEKIKEIVNEIYGEFLKFNLRNGELRKKSDSIKWNLKKLEEIMYDVSIKGRVEGS